MTPRPFGRFQDPALATDVARSSPFEFEVTLCLELDQVVVSGGTSDCSAVVELSGAAELVGSTTGSEIGLPASLTILLI